jgi:hypothetical protein
LIVCRRLIVAPCLWGAVLFGAQEICHLHDSSNLVLRELSVDRERVSRPIFVGELDLDSLLQKFVLDPWWKIKVVLV